jgi:hypothetical protein
MKKVLGFVLVVALSLFGNTVLGGGHGEANSFGFALVVPAEEVARVDALLQSHRDFMNNTHSVTGDMDSRLNSYSVIKAPEMVQFGDPSKGMTGNLIYILSEHYESSTGLAKHLAAGGQWKDIGEMQEIMGKYGVAVVMGEKVSAMNR